MQPIVATFGLLILAVLILTLANKPIITELLRCQYLLYRVQFLLIDAMKQASIGIASTRRVTPEESAILTASGYSRYSRGDTGWCIPIGGDPDLQAFPIPEIPRPSDGLAGAIRHAQAIGCKCLLLDRDAPPYAGVPIYERQADAGSSTRHPPSFVSKLWASIFRDRRVAPSRPLSKWGGEGLRIVSGKYRYECTLCFSLSAD